MITKTLPLRLKYQYDFGISDCFLGLEKSSLENNDGATDGRPICRDYLNKDCHRGKKCKFAHVDQVSVLAAEAEQGLEIQQEGRVKRPRMIVEDYKNCPEINEYGNLRSSHSIVHCAPNSK